MPRLRLPSLILLGLVLLSLALYPLPPAPARAAAPASPFGMNLYITGLERSEGERVALLDRAREAGVRWSREE